VWRPGCCKFRYLCLFFAAVSLRFPSLIDLLDSFCTTSQRQTVSHLIQLLPLYPLALGAHCSQVHFFRFTCTCLLAFGVHYSQVHLRLVSTIIGSLALGAHCSQIHLHSCTCTDSLAQVQLRSVPPVHRLTCTGSLALSAHCSQTHCSQTHLHRLTCTGSLALSAHCSQVYLRSVSSIHRFTCARCPLIIGSLALGVH